MGLVIAFIWFTGAYFIISIRRPKEDAEIIAAIAWPVVYSVVFLIKYSDVIHKKYWAWKSFQPPNSSKEVADAGSKK